jgi:hypothetical protein
MKSRTILQRTFLNKRSAIQQRLFGTSPPQNSEGLVGSLLSLAPSPYSVSVLQNDTLVFTTLRYFSSSTPDDWRKQQLQKLQRKFQANNTIESEEELQPMWKEMEGRVTRRKPRTVQQTGGRAGHMNVRKTDEDVWAQEGMYDENNNNNNKTKK